MTTLQETERRRRQSQGASEEEARRREAREQARGQALHQIGEHAVLTFLEWCALNGFSPGTGRRIINAGTGPVVTQLSKRRIGITVGNNIRWQASRARGVE